MHLHIGTPAGISTVIEPELGGRWSSIRGPRGREWLWRNESAREARVAVQPGDPFVDDGGLEECCPTISGAFDHGDIWDRPWREVNRGWLFVDGHDYSLARRVEAVGDALVADYQLEAAPGFRFVWAGHTSLALSEAAWIVAPDGHPTRLWLEHWRTWPDLEQVDGPWPAPHGSALDTLGRDGTGNFFMLLDLSTVTVRDGDADIRFRLDAPGQPIAIAVWRNLGAWPPGAPYRSVAIEPAIGWHFDRDRAGQDEIGVVPESGMVTWRLTVSATA